MQLFKGARYGDSQQLVGFIWSATPVGEAAEIILILVDLVDTNKDEWEFMIDSRCWRRRRLLEMGSPFFPLYCSMASRETGQPTKETRYGTMVVGELELRTQTYIIRL
jgi:hypothetical protein